MRFKQLWSLLTLIGLVMGLSGLGMWQLKRAKVKQDILQAFEQARLAPIRDCPVEPMPLDFEKCRYRGRLGRELLFLDNQFMGHELGYEVFAVMALTSGQRLLVDMGWIARGVNRQNLPEVKRLLDLSFTGQAYYPKLPRLRLGPVLERQQGDNYVIEYLDLPAVAKIVKCPLLPWVLRMSLHQSSGLKRAWQLVSVPPARHYAYAAQWFGMAMVIFLIFIWRIVKQCNNED